MTCQSRTVLLNIINWLTIRGILDVGVRLTIICFINWVFNCWVLMALHKASVELQLKCELDPKVICTEQALSILSEDVLLILKHHTICFFNCTALGVGNVTWLLGHMMSHLRKYPPSSSLLPSHCSGVYKKNELHFEIFIWPAKY